MESKTCNRCDKTFSSISNLNKHIRENKSCSDGSKEHNFKQECMWCKNKYDKVKNHMKSCKSDKEAIYSHALEIIVLKDKENKELKTQLKDLQEKLFKLANKSTNTTNTITTYNTILNCDKPLILDKEYVQDKMNEYCGISYLKRGGEGICDWFLESVCTNERGNLCIECVDKNRKRFKFEDENEKMNEITGKEIVDLIKSCYPNFKNSLHYQSFLQEVDEYCDRTYPKEEASLKKFEYLKNIELMYNDFVNRLVDRTHKDSFRTLINLKSN